MAVEVQINHWCDPCLEAGDRTPGKAIAVSINAQPFKSLDLCERHTEALVQPLAEALSAWGANPERKADATTKQAAKQGPADERRAVTCLVCSVKYAPSALHTHLKVQHNTTLIDVYGTMCPLCGTAFERMASLGVHVSKGHVAGGVAEAFDEAVKAGDPHGVVAARRKVLADRPVDDMLPIGS